MLEFSTSKILTAKKEHTCDLCGQKIEVGEKYNRYSGKFDGSFFDCCYHESCFDIIGKYCRIEGEEEYSEDWLQEWIYDKVCRDCPNEEECQENTFRCKKVIEIILEGRAFR